jgi:hypothetical protein
MEDPQKKVERELSYDPVIPLLGIILKEQISVSRIHLQPHVY